MGKGAPSKKLNARQSAFVDEYLIDFNATQAAIRAGYSAKTAQPAGSRLLSNVMVSKAIQEAIAARSERTVITADDVIRGLAEFARGPNELTRDRIKSYYYLGQNLGMFNTLKIQGDAENPVVVTAITERIIRAPRD